MWLYPCHVTFAFAITSSLLTLNRPPFPPLCASKAHQPVLESYQWMSDILWEVVETLSELCFSPPTQSHSSGLLRENEGSRRANIPFKISLCPVGFYFFSCPSKEFPSLWLLPSLGCGVTTEALFIASLAFLLLCLTVLSVRVTNERGTTSKFHSLKLTEARYNFQTTGRWKYENEGRGRERRENNNARSSCFSGDLPLLAHIYSSRKRCRILWNEATHHMCVKQRENRYIYVCVCVC